MKAKIPKLLIQTSPESLDNYQVHMTMRFCNGWTYQHFDDSAIFEFFRSNPSEEFIDIESKFLSFTSGAHRADLFRYYYLYLNGGVYLDSDAVIEAPIEEILMDNDFVTIRGYHIKEPLIFNGFLAATPKSPIMLAALRDTYMLDDTQLNDDYHLICKNLLKIVEANRIENIMVYQEERTDDFYAGVRTFGLERALLLTHYCYVKRVPKITNRLSKLLYALIFSRTKLFRFYLRHFD